MRYNVKFTNKALKQLGKLDKFQARLIYEWIMKNLEGCENPRVHGKGLVENHSGEWRYRVGNYRILANIKDNEIEIEIIKIGHRREIYVD